VTDFSHVIVSQVILPCTYVSVISAIDSPLMMDDISMFGNLHCTQCLSHPVFIGVGRGGWTRRHVPILFEVEGACCVLSPYIFGVDFL